MHSLVMVIHIYYKFHVLMVIGYLVMAHFTVIKSVQGQ